MKTKLLYLVSHPIQYQAPMLRLISSAPDIELKVIFESDFSDGAYRDAGFGLDVAWDVPLREGYNSALMKEVDVDTVLRECDVAWLHGWESAVFRKILAQAHISGKPVLMRGENWDGAMPDGVGPKAWLRKRYHKNIFSKCSAFLSIGSMNRQYYLKRGVPENCIFDMPYAVDNDFFASGATEDAAKEFKRSIGLQAHQKSILFAGKFSARKRPELVLQAWQKAEWPNGESPVLIFAGDGELRKELELNSPENVKFIGFRNQTALPAVYGAADVFVLASEREPWGVAVNEAMASGTAVIVSDQCGAAADLVDNSVGAVVPTGDVEALAGFLPSVMANSGKMGMTAQKKISSWDLSADLAGLKSALSFVLDRM